MKYSFCNLFRRLSQPARKLFQPSRRSRHTRGKNRVHLEVQALEDRTVPTIFFDPWWGPETVIHYNIKSLSSENVRLIFWDPNSELTSAKKTQFYDAANKLLSSSYLGVVQEYNSDGVATLTSSTLDKNAFPGQLNESNLEAEVSKVENGRLDSGTTYVVVTPPSELPNAQSQQGFGSNATGNNTLGFGVQEVPVVWDGWTDTVDHFTLALSHEMAEEMSDPIAGYLQSASLGAAVNPSSTYSNAKGVHNLLGAGQIGDFEGNAYSYRMTNNVLVQPVWSDVEKSYIVDDGFMQYIPNDPVMVPMGYFEVQPQWSFGGGSFQTENLKVLGNWARLGGDAYSIGSTTGGGFWMNADGQQAEFDPKQITSTTVSPVNKGGSVTVNASNDTVNIDVKSNGLFITLKQNGGAISNTFQFDSGMISSITVDETGGTNTISVNNVPSGVSNITIQAMGGTNYAGIENLPAWVSLKVNGYQNVSFSPNAQDLSTIQGTVIAADRAMLTLNDQNGAAGTTYGVYAGEIDRTNRVFIKEWNVNSVILNTPSSNPGKVTVYPQEGAPLPLVTVNGAPHSGPALVVDDTTYGSRQQNTSTYSLTSRLVNAGDVVGMMQAWEDQSWIIYYTNLASLELDTTTFANVVNVEGTPAPTTISNRSKLASQVNVAPKSMDLSNLGYGQLTVHGNGTVALAVNDQDDLVGQLRYTISAGELKTQQGGAGSNPIATIDYDNIQKLDIHCSPNDIQADVVSSPGTVNLWASSNTTVNVCPTKHNLDGLGSLGVYNANPGTFNWLDPQGSIAKIKGPSLNVHDEANHHSGGSYSVSDFHLSRSAASQPDVDIDYDIGTSLSLYTGSMPSDVKVDSTPGPTSISCGAADTVSVSVGVNNFPLGLLTVDAHGGTLTLNGQVIADVDWGDGSGAAGGETHDVTYTVTDHSLNWLDHWKETVVTQYDPELLNSPHKVVVSHYQGYNSAWINYQNVAKMTINGGPVDTTFVVKSTPAGTPLTITASTDQWLDTVNHFVVGDNGSVKNIRSQLTFNGSSPADSVLVDDSSSTTLDVLAIANGQSGDVQVGMGVGNQFFGSTDGLDCSGIGSLTVNLSKKANDIVHLSPSTTTAFTINGDPSEYQLGFGAELDIVLGGTTDAQLTRGAPGAGTWGFSQKSHQPITFTNVKTTQPQ
jgi:hypothetical protein